MDKDNKYYNLIETLVKNHKKFPGYEAILEDIVDDVYSHSEVIINSIDNESVIKAYLEKVISTSIITVPKQLNFHNELKHRTVSSVSIEPTQKVQPQTEEISLKTIEPETTEILVEEEIQEPVQEITLQEDTQDDYAETEESVISIEPLEESPEESLEEALEETLIKEEPEIKILEPGATQKVNPAYVDKMINSIEPEYIQIAPRENQIADDDAEILFEKLDDDTEVQENSEQSEDISEDVEDNFEEIGLDNDFTEETEEHIAVYDETDSNDEIELLSDEIESEEDSTEETEENIVLCNEIEPVEEFSEEDSAEDVIENIEEPLVDEDEPLTIAFQQEQEYDNSDALEISNENIDESYESEESQELVEDDNNIEDISPAEDEEITLNQEEPAFTELEAEDSSEEFENISIEEETIEENDITLAEESTEDLIVDEDAVQIEVSDDNMYIDSDESTELDVSNNIEELSIVEDNSNDFIGLESEEEEILTPDSDESDDLSLEEPEELSILQNDDNLISFDDTEDDSGSLDLVDDGFSINLEEDTPASTSSGNNSKYKPTDYSAFSYTPDYETELQADAELGADLLKLNKEKPELHILEVFELRYKQNKKINDIVLQLGTSPETVVNALNEMARIV